MSIPKIETKSKEEIIKFQESQLPNILGYLNSNSNFYRRLFDDNSINLNTIKTLGDLTRIPVTTKNDLQKHNHDFLCVEKDKVIDYITTSGTLGEPVIFAMTNGDLERLAYNEYISFLCADTTKEDIYQLLVTLDKRFIAGMAYFMGLRKLGAGIIRTGPGLQKMQFESIRRFNPTGFVTVPSFIPKLITYALNNNISLNGTSIKKAICIGEPIRNPDFTLNQLGRKITKEWDLKLYSTYASTEMGTAFTECSEGKGGHHHPEMIIVEFLDENNNPVSEGEAGEVTITTIGVEGMPLLRFKTGDMCYHHTEPCKCGRTTMRLGPVIGRKQQMIKLKGTTIYPPAIYDILNEIDYIDNYIVEVSSNELGIDELLIKIGSLSHKSDNEKNIKDNFRAKLRVAPEIEFHSPQEIVKLHFTNDSRKPKVFIDNR